MLKNYKLINNVLGWAVCIFASTVFVMTAEPSVSFWDCGEYIATAHKLQVGHPPGAPTFQLIGCLFSLFASNPANVAFCINAMSALCSGLTILFLFWTITMLGQKLALAKKDSKLTDSKVMAIFGSGIVGALAYTFTDTFWFSAVEGEVYAMSSLCTAIVFWAILKWDQVADDNYSYRWIVLIGYIIGLSIGVHLLNLLTLPAMVLVVYFRKYKSSTKGIIYALLISFVLVGVILWGIVPGIVKYSSVIERLFVNTFHTGFNVGTIIYFVLIAGLLAWGLWYSEKKKKRLLNMGLLSLVFLLVGYSTFLILPIRSNANTPIDENNPEDAVALLSYLNREQYGTHPLVYGQQFNTPVIDNKDGSPVYVRKFVVSGTTGDIRSFFTRFDAQQFIENSKEKREYGELKIKERYEVGDGKAKEVPIYDSKYTVLFPRMWSSSGNHIAEYKNWAGITGPDSKADRSGRTIPNIPSFGENMKFFINYQMWYMYGRYFMWNFVGRQTLDQGMGGQLSGEWLSGIKFIDEARLGPQDMPEHMKNKARNTYYFLPLILGLLGLYFQFSRNGKNGLVVLMLFVMTGIAIGVYLNMYAYQPRERDYAFAASFYAFSIWIGLGVYAIYEWIKKYFNKKAAAAVSTVVCMGVPVLLAAENWDDHDRSQRYLVREIGKSYLDACAPNAILFVAGDNDTFPLWYLQEVEGYRTDVRICNLSLMQMDWHVDQAVRKAYDGEPVPLRMTKDMYQSGTRDFLQGVNKIKEPQNIKDVMQEIYKPANNQKYAFINAIDFYIDVDKEKVLKNGTVPADLADYIVDRVTWRMPIRYSNERGDTIGVISKAYIVMMDILANNNWERPIYYVGTSGGDVFFGLENYLQAEGMVHRLVPVYSNHETPNILYVGRVHTDILYDNLMNKYNLFQFGDENIFLSEDFTRMTGYYKTFLLRLSEALIRENKLDSAEKVLDRCYQWFPKTTIPYEGSDFFYIGRFYLECKTPTAVAKGVDYLNQYADQLIEEITYYNKFKDKKAKIVAGEKDRREYYLGVIHQICSIYSSTVDTQYKDALTAIATKAEPYLSR